MEGRGLKLNQSPISIQHHCRPYPTLKNKRLIIPVSRKKWNKLRLGKWEWYEARKQTWKFPQGGYCMKNLFAQIFTVSYNIPNKKDEFYFLNKILRICRFKKCLLWKIPHEDFRKVAFMFTYKIDIFFSFHLLRNIPTFDFFFLHSQYICVKFCN